LASEEAAQIKLNASREVGSWRSVSSSTVASSPLSFSPLSPGIASTPPSRRKQDQTLVQRMMALQLEPQSPISKASPTSPSSMASDSDDNIGEAAAAADDAADATDVADASQSFAATLPAGSTSSAPAAPSPPPEVSTLRPHAEATKLRCTSSPTPHIDAARERVQRRE
jgi:hypothetical protein